MIIHLHCLSWNEMPVMDFFFRHYDRIVDHYFIRDDGSDDGTIEALSRRPNVTVAPKDNPHADSYVLNSLHAHQTNWKASRGTADWVIVVDMDEHVHHADLAGYLRRQKDQGVTAIPGLGFQMLSRDFPAPGAWLARDLRWGSPWRNMSKLAVFRPDQIAETAFTPGRHSAQPQGNVVYPARDEMYLLHYKYLGMDRIMARHAAAQNRRGPLDLRNQWGHRYGLTQEQTRADFEQFAATALDLDSMKDPHLDHTEPRWWRAA